MTQIIQEERKLEEIPEIVQFRKRVLSGNKSISLEYLEYILRSLKVDGIIDSYKSKELEKELIKFYTCNAKTMNVSDASKVHNVDFIHCIPEYSNKESSINNRFLDGKEYVGFRDFFNLLLDNTPSVSASSVRGTKPASSREELFSPYGIIISEGKIYDA